MYIILFVAQASFYGAIKSVMVKEKWLMAACKGAPYL